MITCSMPDCDEIYACHHLIGPCPLPFCKKHSEERLSARPEPEPESEPKTDAGIESAEFWGRKGLDGLEDALEARREHLLPVSDGTTIAADTALCAAYDTGGSTG